MTPPPGERPQGLRRFGHAVRSTPARPATDRRPGDLIAGAHSRGYLPHVITEGGTYFVTFRLADSLPREVITRLYAQRHAALKKAAQSAREAQRPAERAAERAYFRAFEEALDSARGECWLRRPKIAGIVAEALLHFDHARYRLGAWSVLPNHVHAIVTPLPGAKLSGILHTWKSFTAKAANALLPEKVGRAFWQKESYDHWCRDDAEVVRCVRYVEQNPVKANLCRTAEEWPWSSAGSRGRLEACGTAGEDACATAVAQISGFPYHKRPACLDARRSSDSST
jgi:REP element-mobilizing transposase RayT